jgi:hypothetical protein
MRRRAANRMLSLAPVAKLRAAKRDLHAIEGFERAGRTTDTSSRLARASELSSYRSGASSTTNAPVSAEGLEVRSCSRRGETAQVRARHAQLPRRNLRSSDLPLLPPAIPHSLLHGSRLRIHSSPPARRLWSTLWSTERRRLA